MQKYLKFYINGQWVEPLQPETLDVINPATEEPFAVISVGSAADVDRAVKAARAAFASYSQTTIEERLDLLHRIKEVYTKRFDDIAAAISNEMGAPHRLAYGAQTEVGLRHLDSTVKALKTFPFNSTAGNAIITHEAIGVCGLITPWNWPINQIVSKVAPALAAGCTMLLKPSEIAPISGLVFAEVLDEAGVPAGVFNLINGYGITVGEAMSAHPDIDMMSFTGSTRGGTAVARAAADTVKRVSLELGGKSPNIILGDADFDDVVTRGIRSVMSNSGQSCNAPTRMIVPSARMLEVIEIARKAAANITPGQPDDEEADIGPVVSQVQFEKIQHLIQTGIDEGATLVAGGPGKPEGLETGYFVRPTVFANVDNKMTIAREEIFGPVVSILGYADEEDAVEIANDTAYGLAGYICSNDMEKAQRLAKRIRAGQIHINYTGGDTDVPFGGYKQSGNGREKGLWGLSEFLEVKAIAGLPA
ncbi:MAG: aldehyde dehydrogenase family protein [Caldilineaceae bacterium]|nr:aldehyde dehydrogenase family protein [Caldilineaceae bacterium]